MIETENARERGSGVAAMDEKKTGMGLLREAARLLCAVPGNAGCGVAYALGNGCGDHESCSECVGASLATIADRIEREREELDKRLMPEIVRCRDCQHWDRCLENERYKDINPDGYCAWGERGRS